MSALFVATISGFGFVGFGGPACLCLCRMLCIFKQLFKHCHKKEAV